MNLFEAILLKVWIQKYRAGVQYDATRREVKPTRKNLISNEQQNKFYDAGRFSQRTSSNICIAHRQILVPLMLVA